MFLSLTGAYQMLPEPGQYPSPFPKVAALVPPVHPEAIMPSFPDQDVVQLVCFLCVFHANMTGRNPSNYHLNSSQIPDWTGWATDYIQNFQNQSMILLLNLKNLK